VTGTLIEGVRTGQLDLAFTQFVGSTPREVTSWMVACEPPVAACAPGHWLAGRRDIALPDLINETFIELNPESGTRQLVDQSFRYYQAKRHIGFEVNDFPTQLDLVGNGLGIALMPAAVVARRSGNMHHPIVASAELMEPEPCWELAAVFAHDGHQQPVGAVPRMFLDVLRPSLAEEFAVPEFAA
jgi:DNA-binding transcriptional LysR family regulator